MLATEIRAGAPAAGAPLNPHTKQPLRPGQRLPTVEERNEAIGLNLDTPLFSGSCFPLSEPWECVPENTFRWLQHNFAALRNESMATRPGWPYDDLFAELLADLDAWYDLARKASQGRGPWPPPLHRYLRPGRATFGLVRRVARELGYTRHRDRFDPDYPEDDPTLEELEHSSNGAV